jgi:hypothetical protein
MKHASYTDPELNASKFLGLELSRDRDRRIIKITMIAKIEELAEKHSHATRKKRNVPMPVNGYVVRDHEIEALSDSKKRKLNQEEITVYMAIVGSLIWIQGVRLDIIFAVLYGRICHRISEYDKKYAISIRWRRYSITWNRTVGPYQANLPG